MFRVVKPDCMMTPLSKADYCNVKVSGFESICLYVLFIYVFSLIRSFSKPKFFVIRFLLR